MTSNSKAKPTTIGRTAHLPENMPTPPPRPSIAEAMKYQQEAINCLDQILTQICSAIQPILVHETTSGIPAEGARPVANCALIDAIQNNTDKIYELCGIMAHVRDRIAL